MPVTNVGSFFSSEVKITPLGAAGATIRVLYIEEAAEAVEAIVRDLGKDHSWEITHASNPGLARAIARKQPVDVALVSATMASMDVAELATELTQLHPKITIFILAPQTGEASDQAHASGRYQLLPKPCETKALIAAVERMASLVSWLTNNTTLEMVSGIHSLPTIPSNYQGVIRTIHSPNSSIQEIGEAVNKDMGMTSRVIQVANSAYYGYSKRITNPTEAALLLGIETLKSLVRYTHVLNNFPHAPSCNAMFDLVWRHSIGVAAVARKITLIHTENESLGEEAFTAGLLHDIGKLVLMAMKPDEYKQVLRNAAESKTSGHIVERVKLGTTHSETGAYLLSLWGIPFSILEAVAWHHYPGESREKQFSPLTAVHIANVSEHRRTNPDNLKAAPNLDERYLRDVGIWPKIEEYLKLAPDKPKRDEISQQPYIVKPAAPASATAPPTPWWIWLILAGTASLVAWLLFGHR